ncbi:hypothetical protein L916_18786 [Phytophthora nicotianae]|uniref:Uncharacterized protein n=1 Tax=Phytophthora nicotianae TaxID=4792 RepID=W2I2W8_PHYNI|nr:hypothetical protein L916_18786 [Phytophthora nicotianae]
MAGKHRRSKYIYAGVENTPGGVRDEAAAKRQKQTSNDNDGVVALLDTAYIEANQLDNTNANLDIGAVASDAMMELKQKGGNITVESADDYESLEEEDLLQHFDGAYSLENAVKMIAKFLTAHSALQTTP